MEEVERKESLSKFYTLRAGLSVMSVEKDKMIELEDQITDRTKQHDKKIQNINERILKNDNSIKECEFQKRIKIGRAVWRSLFGSLRWPLFSVLSLLLGVFFAFWSAYTVESIFDTDFLVETLFSIRQKVKIIRDSDIINWIEVISKKSFYYLDNATGFFMLIIQIFIFLPLSLCSPILMLGGFLGSVFCIIIFLFIEAWGGIPEFFWTIRWALRKFKEKTEAPNIIENLEREIIHLKNEIKEENYIFEEYKKQNRNVINQKAKACLFLFRATEKEYGGFCDYRDWKNLDLLIFYYETKRVDNMKEALQLVDQQRRNDLIVESIQEAKNAICETIRSGLQHLEETMVQCFNVLAEEMQSLQSQMQRVQQSLREVQEEQNAQLNNLISAVNFNNALREKANVASTELVKDVHYLRTLAVNIDNRRYNNA